jgi:glycosyltransferase involved in cell wall biosynthesis
MEIALEPFRHLVSIIVPAINEESTVEPVLKALAALDFQGFDLGKEIIFVDGGSTDRTFEIAGSVAGVKAFQLPKGSRGRGAAMRLGLEQARGDTVVFFPADLEYTAGDIHRVLSGIVKNDYKAVFGTRNVKCTDLSARLSGIYGNARGLYLLSKYGGMLLSMVTLLLYNRYVSDLLTCLMAFDTSLLRSLALQANGLDIQTEIVAKLCNRRQYILEVPVDYMPRTRSQGKKTTPLDGFQAMLPLFRGKYAGSVR